MSCSELPRAAVEPTWQPTKMGRVDSNMEAVPSRSIHQKKEKRVRASAHVRMPCSMPNEHMIIKEIQADDWSTPCK